MLALVPQVQSQLRTRQDLIKRARAPTNGIPTMSVQPTVLEDGTMPRLGVASF